MSQELIFKAIGLASLVVAVMIHEISHGLMAWYCGDTTARDAGRISLNPIRHIDPIGTIVLPLILAFSGTGFMVGWAKPVPVNIGRCRNPRQAYWMTAIAGPLSNLVQAILAVLVYHLILPMAQAGPESPYLIYTLFACMIFAMTNIVLMTFNLIPIPPLDGSRVMAILLPQKFAIPYMRLERFGFIVLIVLLNLDSYLNLNVFSRLINHVINGFMTFSGMSW